MGCGKQRILEIKKACDMLEEKPGDLELAGFELCKTMSLEVLSAVLPTAASDMISIMSHRVVTKVGELEMRTPNLRCEDVVCRSVATEEEQMFTCEAIPHWCLHDRRSALRVHLAFNGNTCTAWSTPELGRQLSHLYEPINGHVASACKFNLQQRTIVTSASGSRRRARTQRV
jgi:hypothetical protein